jgi:hypothetical protein
MKTKPAPAPISGERLCSMDDAVKRLRGLLSAYNAISILSAHPGAITAAAGSRMARPQTFVPLSVVKRLKRKILRGQK